MYKLTIVAGPDAGSSYTVQDGENSIGRVEGNRVVLNSAKVSKRHCVLVASGGELIVRDNGSANGTFVNGVLTREKNLHIGDRISVGEFVLELSEKAVRQKIGSSGGAVIPFPVVGGAPGNTGMNNLAMQSMGLGAPVPGSTPGGTSDIIADAANAIPTDLVGKALFYFERIVMPIFYGLNQKNQWRLIGAGLLAAFGLANVFLSVQPILQSGRETVIVETGRRATFMARLIAEHNAPLLAQKAETKTELMNIDTAEAVRVAALTDLDGRIIAPAAKMNQYLTSGGEAVIANKARDLFRRGRETGVVAEADESTIVAVEPVKVLSTDAGKNVVIGMAVVSLDTSLATMGLGEMGIVYSETMILTILVGGLILLIMYRMTLKPLQVLSDEIDKALKGELTQVTHEFKLEELDGLWDLINSALQRLPRGGSSANGGQSETPFNIEEFTAPFRRLSEGAKFGLVVCDGERKIQYLNPVFEEASGIRGDNSVGQEITAVARDQAFIAMMNDLFDRSPVSPDGVGEDIEFSGIQYRIHVTAYLAGTAAAKAYVVTANRNGEE